MLINAFFDEKQNAYNCTKRHIYTAFSDCFFNVDQCFLGDS